MYDLNVWTLCDPIFRLPRNRLRPDSFTGYLMYMDLCTREEAALALKRLHNTLFAGHRLNVTYAGLRTNDGSDGTGTAKGTNLEAWETKELEQKVQQRKHRHSHISLFDPPENAIGLRGVEPETVPANKDRRD